MHIPTLTSFFILSAGVQVWGGVWCSAVQPTARFKGPQIGSNSYNEVALYSDL